MEEDTNRVLKTIKQLDQLSKFSPIGTAYLQRFIQASYSYDDTYRRMFGILEVVARMTNDVEKSRAEEKAIHNLNASADEVRTSAMDLLKFCESIHVHAPTLASLYTLPCRVREKDVHEEITAELAQIIERMQDGAPSTGESTPAKKERKLFHSGHNEGEGEWSAQDTLSAFAGDTGLKRKTQQVLAQTGLIRKTRHNWIVRLDTLKPEWAEEINGRQEREGKIKARRQ